MKLGVKAVSIFTVVVLFLLAAALGPLGLSSAGLLIGAACGVFIATRYTRKDRNKKVFFASYAALGTLLFISGMMTFALGLTIRGIIDLAIGAAMMVFGLRNR